jgi:predicted nuclease of predicted toxin-antitoxin system
LKFLIDNAVSPAIAAHLRIAGHDAIHVRDCGLGSARDELILERAAIEGRILVSADTDFGDLLAETGAARPSVVLFRRTSGKPVEEIGLLSATLRHKDVQDALERGCIVVVEPKKIRIRALPIGGESE